MKKFSLRGGFGIRIGSFLKAALSQFFFEILKIGLLLNYSAKNKKTMLKNNSFFYISINVSKSMQ